MCSFTYGYEFMLFLCLNGCTYLSIVIEFVFVINYYVIHGFKFSFKDVVCWTFRISLVRDVEEFCAPEKC